MTKRSKIEAKCVVRFHEFMENAHHRDVALLHKMLKQFAKEPVDLEELVRYEARRCSEEMDARRIAREKAATPESSALQYRLMSQEPEGEWVEDLEVTSAEFQELKDHLAMIRIVTA